jgi:hypothetical protein
MYRAPLFLKLTKIIVYHMNNVLVLKDLLLDLKIHRMVVFYVQPINTMIPNNKSVFVLKATYPSVKRSV